MRVILIIVMTLLGPASARGQAQPVVSAGAGVDLVFGKPAQSFSLGWWVIDNVSLDARVVYHPRWGALIGGGPTLRLGNETTGFFVSQYVAGQVGDDRHVSPWFHFRLGVGVRFSVFEAQLSGGFHFWRWCYENDPNDVYVEVCRDEVIPTGSLTLLFNLPRVWGDGS